MELKGVNAIITGASGELGCGLAVSLGAAGCRCVCHYHSNERRAVETVERIRLAGGEAMALRADITKEQEVEELFGRAEEFGVVRVLVNGAGIFESCSVDKLDIDEIGKMLDINLVGAMLASGCFVRRLGDERGKIVNIADVGGVMGWGGYSAYCASKAGLIGATKAMAKELAPAVCVNAVAPGVVTWPAGFSDNDKKRQEGMIPLGRKGEVEEVAEAVEFLLRNDYVTGQVLNVDGGRCI